MTQSPSKREINVGTRKSQLALIQTNLVVSRLKSIYPDLTFNTVPISTTGDQILDVALSKIGSKSLFTKELEVALHENTVDFVVHSLKDMPTTLPDGMSIGAILERENPRDAVVMSLRNKSQRLENLEKGSVIGTSSVRRIAQLKAAYPHLEFKDVRGNLNTRICKLDAQDSPYSALILAYAGLARLGWHDRISQLLEPEVVMYAVGQGALGVECRHGDAFIEKLLQPLDDFHTRIVCTCERAFMRTLEGGCSVPLGVNCNYINFILSLQGTVSKVDGTSRLFEQSSIEIPENLPLDQKYKMANDLGQSLALSLIDKGAREILNSIRQK